MRWIRALAPITAFCLAGATASAYTPGDVSDGGTIKGRIAVSDTALKDESKPVTKDKSYCGDDVPAEKHIVSADGGLQNAVVMISEIAQGKAFPSQDDFIVTNSKCRFEPHVMVAPKGALMKVRNDDPVLHNSHFYLVRAKGKKNVINLALPKQGVEIGKKKILRKPGLLSLQCDAHDFMQAWVWVVEHPYAVVSAANGDFVLEDVPAGNYQIKVWHESLGEKTIDVVVESGKTASANLSY